MPAQTSRRNAQAEPAVPATPISIFANRQAISWKDQSLSFKTFFHQTQDGKWNHNPTHQREVVHPHSWGSKIIDSAMWFSELPPLYFHPRRTEAGTIVYESLDGKQRASQIIAFMNSEYALKTFRPEFEHLNGKKFKDMDQLNQDEIGDLEIHVRISNRTLTNDEIYELFSRLQDNKRTSTGEKLNAMPSACFPLVDETLTDATTQLDGIKPGSDKRKGRTEAVVRCLKSWEFSQDDTKALTDKPRLEDWYQKAGAPSDASSFKRACILTFQILATSNLPHKGAISTILPVFRIISKCLIEKPSNLPEVCKNITRLDAAFFKKVDGEHNAALTRYQVLREELKSLL